MFLTLTNTKYEHLLPPKTLHKSQMWAEPLWEQPGGISLSTDHQLRVGNTLISVVTAIVNKKFEGLGYWLIEEGEDKAPFFKTGSEITEAINNGKIKII